MNLANATVIAQRVELDLAQEQVDALSSLESQRDALVKDYGQVYYDSIYEETFNYYANNFKMASILKPPTNSQDPSSPITSGFSIFSNPSTSDMIKLSNKSLGLTKEREIRPSYTKRIKGEIPFLIQMVDRDFKSYGIGIAGNTILTSVKLTPNPETFTINSSKIINRYNTMTRWVEEHWGDEIDNITFSGSTYSFFAHQTEGIPEVGLTLKYRNGTKSYEMLRELSKIFQVNGMIYQDNKTYEGSGVDLAGYTSPTDIYLNDPDYSNFILRHPREGLAKERLYINMQFDYVSVLGYFENFDIVEEEGSPFRMTYNSVFKAEKTKYHQGPSATLRL